VNALSPTATDSNGDNGLGETSGGHRRYRVKRQQSVVVTVLTGI